MSALMWRNEWRLLVRHPLVWIALAGVAGFSLIIARGSPADPGTPALAALLRINLFFPAYILPFLAGALGPIHFLRETDHGMAELFGAYPITSGQWLAMRLGNFTLALIGACMIAQFMFLAVLAPDHPGQLAAMLGHSLLWLVVLHVPSCLIWATALGWLACRKANSGYLYIAAGLGWVGYLAVASLIGLPLIAGSDVVFPALWRAMLVLDPYAATALATAQPESGWLQWREANVAAGRIVWLALCLLLMRSIRALPSHAGRQRSLAGPDAPAPTEPRYALAAWLAPGHAGLHFRFFLRDRIFVLMVGAWIALLLPEALGGTDYAEELSRVVPDSRDALNRVVWDVLPVAGALLMLYAADRVCRMYPATRMHELYAATPHRPLRLVLVQVAALWTIASGFIVLAGIAVAVAQLLAGSAIQPGEYLVQLALTLPSWALLILLFVAIHGLIRPRFVANLGCLLLVLLGQTSLAPGLGLEHPLWRPLFTPLARPDHYWGFAGSLAGHWQFLLFWLPFCLAALLLAVASHHRGLPLPQTRLAPVLRSPFTASAAALLCLAAWQGVWIDRTLRQEGLLVSTAERARLRADYERHYAAWADRPQPDVVSITSRVDFHKAGNRAMLRARMALINRTVAPITEVLIGRNRLGTAGAASLRGASVLRHDAALGQTVYRLDRPLAPGAALDLFFAIDLAQSGLDAAAFPFVLRPEFSSLPAHAILPVIGFRRELTLRDPVIRREQGLPELRLTPPSRLPAPKAGSLLPQLVALDTVISTGAGMQGIAQGNLVASWEAGGRRHFRYRTAAPIRSHPVFYAVPWQPQIWSAGRVRIETYAPQPLRPGDHNVLAMRDVLDWLGGEIAPYPGDNLRLLAIPDVGPSGYASPQVVEISHRLGFKARPEAGAGFSQVYRRAAHEAAHQWFGHLLGYGITEEHAFLVESLAKYAELVMIERRFGKPAMTALVRFERDRYRQSRLDPDQSIAPLIDADDGTDMYSRAILVFACVRSKMGDAPITAALRQIATRSRQDQTPARSLDFLTALKAAADPAMQRRLDLLFLGSDPLDRQLAAAGCSGRTAGLE